MKLYWRYENQVWNGYTRYAEKRATVQSVMGDLLWNLKYINDQSGSGVEFSNEKDAMIDAESKVIDYDEEENEGNEIRH